jgi:hypothetical protein
MKTLAGSLLLAVVLAGCGAGSSSAPLDTGAPDTTPTTTGPPATTEPSTPTAWLDDGRYFGFIKSVDLATQPGTVVFDLADFLGGEEANEAAAERGDETPVPNDYYIVNDDPELRTLSVSARCGSSSSTGRTAARGGLSPTRSGFRIRLLPGTWTASITREA